MLPAKCGRTSHCFLGFSSDVSSFCSKPPSKILIISMVHSAAFRLSNSPLVCMHVSLRAYKFSAWCEVLCLWLASRHLTATPSPEERRRPSRCFKKGCLRYHMIIKYYHIVLANIYWHTHVAYAWWAAHLAHTNGHNPTATSRWRCVGQLSTQVDTLRTYYAFLGIYKWYVYLRMFTWLLSLPAQELILNTVSP